MKSKTSFFSASPAIIREDFRRFWAIPVLAFIGYFLMGLLPVLVDYDLITKDGGAQAMIVGDKVDLMLNGQNPFLVANMVWVPILSGLLIFSYLHRTGSVMSVHSQPVTRNTLFGGHFISCVLFTLLPIILMGIVLLIIAKPIYADPTATAEVYSDTGLALTDGAASAAEKINLFSRGAILHWVWDCCLTSVSILSITVFGGMITGTSLHHFIAAVGFNAVVPVSYVLLKMYFGIYLFGYNADNISGIVNLSPLIQSVTSSHFSLKFSLIWLVITVLIILASLGLYRKRRLERATDGIVFKAANVAVMMIFGFLGMSLLGLLFLSLFGGSMAMTVFGYVVGAALAMIIVRMIIMKTIRVFDKSLLKMAISYLVFACIFFAVLVFDLAGFESRVPDAGDADGVKISGFIMDDELYSDDYSYDRYVLTDPESLALAENFHRQLAESEDVCDSAQSYESIRQMQFTYFKGDPDGDDYEETITRTYSVPLGFLYTNQALLDLWDSAEVKRQLADSLEIADENIISSTLNSVWIENGTHRGDIPENAAATENPASADVDAAGAIKLGEEATKELYRIFVNSVQNKNGAERLERSEGIRLFDFSIFYSYEDEDGKSKQTTREFSIRNTDTEAVDWLRAHGYLGELSSYFQSAVITSYEINSEGYLWPQFLVDQTDPQQDPHSVVVTDKSAIETLISGMKSSIASMGMDESLIGSGKVFYLTLWNSENNYQIGNITADRIPEGVTLPA